MMNEGINNFLIVSGIRRLAPEVYYRPGITIISGFPKPQVTNIETPKIPENLI